MRTAVAHHDLDRQAAAGLGKLMILCVVIWPYLAAQCLYWLAKGLTVLATEVYRDIVQLHNGVPPREILRGHLKRLGW